jgi:flavin-dependent dehydrogenase
VIFAFPTNDGLTGVFVAWPRSEFAEVRANLVRRFSESFAQVPDLSERIHNGKRVERLYGTADLPDYFRKPYGAGWALVGDAGHHKDPYLALGICDALRDAEILASAVYDGLSGNERLEHRLSAYEEQRNAATLKDFRENLHMAQFRPPPHEVLATRAAVRGSEEDTRRLFMAQEGMIPVEEFFNPENIGHLQSRTAGP